MSGARADVFADGDKLMAQVGPYVYHYVYDADHNDWPWLVGLEWESAAHWEFGASYFKNSFYQDSFYLYGGKRWFLVPSVNDGPYLKLTVGPLFGYRGQYEDKIPFNHKGTGVGIIPAIGYQFNRVNTQFVVLGNAGFLVTLGYDVLK